MTPAYCWLQVSIQGRAAVLADIYPSGWVEPSEADKHITHRLKDALSLIDVRVLDHLVGAGRYRLRNMGACELFLWFEVRIERVVKCAPPQ